jgi:hypothetical protein
MENRKVSPRVDGPGALFRRNNRAVRSLMEFIVRRELGENFCFLTL